MLPLHLTCQFHN